MRITTADAPATATSHVSRADDDGANGAGPSAGAQFLAVLAGLTPQSSQPATPKNGSRSADGGDAQPPSVATASGANDARAAASSVTQTASGSPAAAGAGNTPVTASDATGAVPGAQTAALDETADAIGGTGTATATDPSATTLLAPDGAAPAAGAPGTGVTTTPVTANTAPTATPAATQPLADATEPLTTATNGETGTDEVGPGGDDDTPSTAPGGPAGRTTTTSAAPTSAAPTTAAATQPAATQPAAPSPAGNGAHDDGRPGGGRATSPVTGTTTATGTTTSAARDTDTQPAPGASHTTQAPNATVVQAPAIATPQPTATPTQVAAPPAPAAPPNPVVTTPVAQLVSVVEPLRNQPDGSYRITVDLHPADLGRVQVEVRLERGEVSLHLQADHASTSALLRDALHDLRDGLHSAGLRTGGVVVGNGDAANGGGNEMFERDTAGTTNRDDTPAGNDADDVTGVATARPPHAPTSSDALVDVRV